MPLQTEVLGRWPDGSIRWLLIDTQVDLAPGEKKPLVLRCGGDVKRAAVDNPARVVEEGDSLVLQTGPLRIKLAADGFRPLSAVWLDADADGEFSESERVTADDRAGIVLKTPDGKTFRADRAKAELAVEQAGPLRVCARAKGRHASADGGMFSYIVRLHAFRGRPFVRMTYTFVNDHQESLMAEVDSIEMAFVSSPASDGVQVLDGKMGNSGRLFQLDEAHYLLNGKQAGRRANGWAAIGWRQLRHGRGTPRILAELAQGPRSRARTNRPGYLPRFRPGAIRWKAALGGMQAVLLPPRREVCLQVRSGENPRSVGRHSSPANRTSKACHVFSGPPKNRWRPFAIRPTSRRPRPPASFRRPTPKSMPATTPFWTARWRRISSDAKSSASTECSTTATGTASAMSTGGNLEYDLAHGLFIQYLRTGDRRFFLRAEQAARHHVDVDVVHADSPLMKNPRGCPPRKGDVWLHSLGHTGGYYQDAPLPVNRSYQMGKSTDFGHVWVSGDLDYYHLTGDRRALDVSLQMADAMVSHIPTRYGTHIRELGWPMVLVLNAYQATGDKKYLAAAAANWKVLREHLDWEKGWVVQLARDHCKHGDRRCYGNVPFMEGLTLCALARYHRITGNPEVLRAITVGIDQMIRECWQEKTGTFRYNRLFQVNDNILFALAFLRSDGL